MGTKEHHPGGWSWYRVVEGWEVAPPTMVHGRSMDGPAARLEKDCPVHAGGSLSIVLGVSYMYIIYKKRLDTIQFFFEPKKFSKQHRNSQNSF